MSTDQDIGFPAGSSDERELLLNWLGYLRSAVLRKLAGISDEQARWRPDGALISLLGIVNHLIRVEWRWIDGGIHGQSTERTETEFAPGPGLTLAEAIVAYQRRGEATDAAVRSASSLGALCSIQPGTDLRWAGVTTPDQRNGASRGPCRCGS